MNENARGANLLQDLALKGLEQTASFSRKSDVRIGCIEDEAKVGNRWSAFGGRSNLQFMVVLEGKRELGLEDVLPRLRIKRFPKRIVSKLLIDRLDCLLGEQLR